MPDEHNAEVYGTGENPQTFYWSCPCGEASEAGTRQDAETGAEQHNTGG